MTQRSSVHGRLRTRWSAIGAAVAVTLGAGSIGLVSATIDDGERPVLVQTEPCRLADTRPTSTVGPRNTPIGEGEEYNIVAHGIQGNCDIPDEAVGLSLNVTAAQATTLTNMRIYPGDSMTPLAASLNPAPDTGPVPNAVTTGLDDDGSFNVYNEFGTVHVIIDVNGYYEDHNHDDRYYTEAEVDAIIDDLDVPRDLTVDGRVLTPTIAGSELITVAAAAGCTGYDSRNTSVFGSLTLPVGATLTGYTATWYDAATADVTIQLWKRSLAIGGGNLQGLAAVTSSGDAGLGSTTSAAMTEVVEPGEQFLVSFIFPTVSEDADLAGLCGLELNLS